MRLVYVWQWSESSRAWSDTLGGPQYIHADFTQAQSLKHEQKYNHNLADFDTLAGYNHADERGASTFGIGAWCGSA